METCFGIDDEFFQNSYVSEANPYRCVLEQGDRKKTNKKKCTRVQNGDHFPTPPLSRFFHALLDRNGRTTGHHGFHLNDRRVRCLVTSSSRRFSLGLGGPASCTFVEEFLKQLGVPVIGLEEKIANVTHNGYQTKLHITRYKK